MLQAVPIATARHLRLRLHCLKQPLTCSFSVFQQNNASSNHANICELQTSLGQTRSSCHALFVEHFELPTTRSNALTCVHVRSTSFTFSHIQSSSRPTHAVRNPLQPSLPTKMWQHLSLERYSHELFSLSKFHNSSNLPGCFAVNF